MNRFNQKFYETPEMEVLETETEQIICASTFSAGNNGYNSNDYNW